MSMGAKRSWPTKLAASLLSAGVLAVSFAGVAAASPNGKGAGKGRGKGGVFAGLTQEQRACIKSKGITRRSGKPTLQQRRAIFEAAKACGVTLPDPASKNPAKQGGGRHRHG
jgi:hypothetical protein